MKTLRNFKLKFNATVARWSLRLIIRLKILSDTEKIKKALKDIDGVAGGRTVEDRRKVKDRRK